MKQNIIFILAIAFTLAFSSCEEKVTAPIIQNIEIGTNNSKTAYIGGDLHLEAEIIASGKIANIRLLIHQEEEGEEAPAQKISSVVQHADEWELDSTYTGVYANVKNTTFHEHVDVPSDAVAGTYHLHLYVTDFDGNQTMIEEEITIQAPVADGSAPTITVTSAPGSGQSFTTGNSITITGNITDIQGLSGIYVGLVSATAGIADASVSSSNSITLLHNHDFEDAKSYAFTATIKVGASTDNDISPKSINWLAGSYYILVKAPAVDGEVSFSAHYPVTISL
jgi:hypothetical protein